MSNKASNHGNWKISELAEHTPKTLIQRIEPSSDNRQCPSADRIKQLALEKRSDHLQKQEEVPMKKASYRVALITAVICLLSITAFAAVGGLDYMKGIFGDSAESIQKEIVTPLVTASEGGRDMALEAMVTDGYVTHMVVSLTGDKPSTEYELFSCDADLNLRTLDWHLLDTFTTKEKTFYAVELVSGERFDTARATLSLNQQIAPLSLSFDIENQLGNAVVEFPEGAMSGETQLRELQVSAMGLLLIGHEGNAQGGLPATNLRLTFTDGKTEDISIEFAPSDTPVSFSGGAVIAGGSKDVPLLSTFNGSRNPDGELVINGQFARVIHADALEKVTIDGVDYPVK